MSDQPPAPEGLVRGMGLAQATAANVLQMIGVGPFLTIPIMLAKMNGPQAILGWVLGLVLAVCDGLVWAELGAAMPGAGGSYIYLREAYGRDTWGLLASFLFIWMIVFTAPLSMASGAVGFAQYLTFLTPLSHAGQVLVAMAVCAAVVLLLYRDISQIGRLSMVMLAVVVLNSLWLVGAGLLHLDAARIFDFPPGAFRLDASWWSSLGAATLVGIYASGGYNNVCYLAGEIEDAPRVIPRAILISIFLVAVLYILMTVSIISVIPWREAMHSKAIASDMLGRLYGPRAGTLVTVMILFTSFASVFALALGCSRIPYAAAAEGRFIPAFGRLHPTGHFPHVSLLVMGAISMVLCVLPLDAIIAGLIALQIVVQTLAQVVAVALIRRHRPDLPRPFRMWLYPLPCIAAFVLWTYVLVTSGLVYTLVSLGVAAVGVAVFAARAAAKGEWPFTK